MATNLQFPPPAPHPPGRPTTTLGKFRPSGTTILKMIHMPPSYREMSLVMT